MKIGFFDVSFLKSTRFWMVTLAVIGQTLVAAGVLSSEPYVSVVNAISAIFGVSVAIRTVDRFGEQK